MKHTVKVCIIGQFLVTDSTFLESALEFWDPLTLKFGGIGLGTKYMYRYCTETSNSMTAFTLVHKDVGSVVCSYNK